MRDRAAATASYERFVGYMRSQNSGSPMTVEPRGEASQGPRRDSTSP